MLFEDAEAIIKKITYKPGSRLWLSYGFCSIELSIQLSIIDANPDPNSKIVVTTLTASYKIHLEHVGSETELLVIVRDIIHRMEIHESDEWFRIDKKLFYNPHANV